MAGGGRTARGQRLRQNRDKTLGRHLNVQQQVTDFVWTSLNWTPIALAYEH
jgi:hypothetical protein